MWSKSSRNKNIRAGIVIALAVLAAISLASCNKLLYGVKDLGSYGLTTRDEPSAILVLTDQSRVTGFDGEAVEWKSALIMPESYMRVPAGTHRVEYVYERVSGGGSPPRQEIRGNRRVTVSTWTPRDEVTRERDVTVTLEPGGVYVLGPETITPHRGTTLQYYDKIK
jgi:hypothetical protein